MRTKCNLVINPENNFGPDDDPFTEFVRIEYGGNGEGIISLQNIVDTFASLNGSASDETSVTDDTDDNPTDTIDGEEENDTDENPSKRKSPEPGCSNQYEMLTETENPKRMRMNSTVESVPSTSSSHTSSEIWETVSNDTSESSELNNDDSASLISSIDSDEREGFETAREHYLNGVYHSLFNNLDDSTNDSEVDSEAARDLVKYRFISNYINNELSKRLKDTIYSLIIPTPLKHFLNYNRID